MTVASGLSHMLKSMFDIDPEEMKVAVNTFQNMIREIQTHLLNIEREQVRQGALLDQMNGGSHEHDAGSLGRNGDAIVKPRTGA
jgi:hypothetical protein